MDDRGHEALNLGQKSAEDPVAPNVQIEPSSPSEQSVRARKARLRALLLLGGLAVMLVGAFVVYLRGGRYESTENAYLQAGQVAVAANISGQVVSIEVSDNQMVKAGQVLFRIDPRPFQAAVDEAQAKLADAGAQIQSKRASYRRGEAQIEAARARLAYANAEAARQKELLSEGISSRNQYDQAVLAVKTAQLDVETTGQQAGGIRAELSGDVGTAIGDQPSVQAARAVLDRAKLNLAYTVVRAAQDGVVTRVHQLQLGNYISAAKPVFALLGRKMWIEANFKENQLRYMRVGQPATIQIDAYPGKTLKAHLTSFSPGTGSSFSLLPAENATGNWVKVVQRLPVELTIDAVPEGVLLQAGLSATATVDTGHVRHILGKDEVVKTGPTP